MKKELKQVSKEVVVPSVVAALSLTYPLLTVPITFAAGFLSLIISLNKNDSEEFLSFVSQNRDLISNELLETENFKKVFTLTFERYLKERADYRKDYIRSIFISTIKRDCDPEFELERFFFIISLLGKKEFEILLKYYDLIDVPEKNPNDFLSIFVFDNIREGLNIKSKEEFEEAWAVLSSTGLMTPVSIFDGIGYKMNSLGAIFKEYVFDTE